MRSQRALLPTFVILLLLPAIALSGARTGSQHFTIQVAAFPEGGSWDQLLATLKRAGQQPIWGTVDLPGRGTWVRVFVGQFRTSSAARSRGADLIKRKLIRDFTVKSAREIKLLSPPRNVAGRNTAPVMPLRESPRTRNSKESASDTSRLTKQLPAAVVRPIATSSHATSGGAWAIHTGLHWRSAGYLTNESLRGSFARTLPPGAGSTLCLVPSVNTDDLPQPDPVDIAFKLITVAERVDSRLSAGGGGLWVSGDIDEALARLRWIAGADSADLITVEQNGRVVVNEQRLLVAAGLSQVRPSAQALILASYITSNEGLLLLVQLTQGGYSYRLHIGKRCPTRGFEIAVAGSINLDNNFDPRINPYRRRGQKLDQERPPEKFDSMVAINPVARWFNLHANLLVPVGHITFHELAEAHAKLALGLDYLGDEYKPGAHFVALEREARLKAQRPTEDVVLTTGSNRVLRSEEEARHFFAEAASSGNNPH
jgi:sporulation related protein